MMDRSTFRKRENNPMSSNIFESHLDHTFWWNYALRVAMWLDWYLQTQWWRMLRVVSTMKSIGQNHIEWKRRAWIIIKTGQNHQCSHVKYFSHPIFISTRLRRWWVSTSCSKVWNGMHLQHVGVSDTIAPFSTQWYLHNHNNHHQKPFLRYSRDATFHRRKQDILYEDSH